MVCTECEEGHYLWPEVDQLSFVQPIYQYCIEIPTSVSQAVTVEDYIWGQGASTLGVDPSDAPPFDTTNIQ